MASRRCRAALRRTRCSSRVKNSGWNVNGRRDKHFLRIIEVRNKTRFGMSRSSADATSHPPPAPFSTWYSSPSLPMSAASSKEGKSRPNLASSGSESQSSSFQAAVARTATRALGLYFSRPVRLFRPQKISGWHSLRGLAAQDGFQTLSPSYLRSLVKTQGVSDPAIWHTSFQRLQFVVIPKHFIPPMAVNALLGTVLWASYAEASSAIHPHITHPVLNAAVAGAVAGGAQALVSAPTENVRLLIEGGTSQNSFWHAWKEVFRGTTTASGSRHDTIEEARRLRSWMREVGDMAGRGWDGLGCTLGKDITGFAAFFAIFEVTRRIALQIRTSARNMDALKTEDNDSYKQHVPQLIYGLTLVTGGVVAGLSYEVIGRPFDKVRDALRLDRHTPNGELRSPVAVVSHKIREEGVWALFRNTSPAAASATASPNAYRRVYGVLRTLARVGPWGVGFLVYQAYETRLDPLD
ncbi:hypothetical protein MKEN_01056900 [Mycena kentingensis (nom. inval.)]|nr:hypothetical protein MKEN_01056900 [Mycena kentingensis (nom. inval.)]